MFSKRITRPMPLGAKLSRDGKKAKITVKGELRTYEVSSTGKLVDYSPRWYCQIGSKMISLSEDRAEAELMEAELLDHKRGGSSKAKKPAVPKSRRELAALMDDCLEDVGEEVIRRFRAGEPVSLGSMPETLLPELEAIAALRDVGVVVLGGDVVDEPEESDDDAE